jgi:hypothetical protein
VHSHRNIPMLWDDDNAFISQQVETNFCEGESPIGCTTFLHYGLGTQQISHKHVVDQNTWHTYQFVIRDHRVRAFVDGALVWDFQGTVLTVPDAWRRLVLQQECAFSGTRTCPTGTTGQEQIQIDWIKLDHLVAS